MRRTKRTPSRLSRASIGVSMGWNATYRATIWARDDDGAISSSRLAYTTAVGAQIHLSALLPLIQAVSNCAIEGCTISNTNYLSDARPGNGVDAHRQAILSFRCDDDSIAVVAVPGVNDAMILTSGPLAGVGIDTSHPAIVALASALISGIAGAIPQSSTGKSMVELVSGYVGYDESRW